MYMKPEELAAARAVAEHFRSAPKDSPVFGISRFLDELIKRGDDYKEALQNMWDAVAICEPNTLGDRVFRHILQQRAFVEMKEQRDLAVEALKDARTRVMELNAPMAPSGVGRSVFLANMEAGISNALTTIAERDKLLKPIPPEKQE